MVGGFAVHTISDEGVSVSMVPELGGRIVSIKDRISKREWLDGWSPARKRRLWVPEDPSDFESGPGAGIDECLPTVLPCQVDGRALPDHGELWNSRPDFDDALAETGVLSCVWRLTTLPLVFRRRVSLKDGGILLEYRIENSSAVPTPFLWAWHALFSWKPGDRIHFPPEVRQCVTPDGMSLPWPESMPGCDLSTARFNAAATPAAKVFVGPLRVGKARITAKNGASISIDWPASLLPHAGIWITRGFWKGLHHWAIEPTNAPADRLSDITTPSSPTVLKPDEIRDWTLVLTPGGAGA